MTVRDFLLPDLGEGLEEAEVVAWRVAQGESVELNQILVEVNTEKALVEIPAPWEGVIAKLHAAEGEVVRVGQPLVSIRVEQAGGDVREATNSAGAVEPSAIEEPPKRRAVLVGYGVAEDPDDAMTVVGATRAPSQDRQAPVAASPPVRRLAKEMAVDLATVSGTGPGGRVTREDVQAAADAAPGEAAAGAEMATAAEDAPASEEVASTPIEGVTRIPVRGTRRLIAERMTQSILQIPQVTTYLTIDATNLMAFRDELSRDSGGKVSPLPIVVRALAETCHQHPGLNSSFDAERSEIAMYQAVHVGIATDTDHGLLVPVVHAVETKGILELGTEIGRLSEAARGGTITPAEMAGGTITVTNVGTFGAEFGTPIVNPPQAAILALGVVEPRALVVQGQVEARPATTLSLSFDHRVLDGAAAGRALRTLADILESPFKLGSLPR